MIGMIITGHGQFASGLISAVDLIAGKQDRLVAVDFLPEDSSESLREKIIVKVNELNCESIIFMTDIAGGTPFNQSVLLAEEMRCNYRVLSGVNMPALLSMIFDRAVDNLEIITENLLNNGQAKVQLYIQKSCKKELTSDAEGI